MPTSKTCLPDVNVWLVLAPQRHVHAPVCSSWTSSIHPARRGGCIGRCWRTSGFQFAPEPFALEPEWKKLTLQDEPTSKIWTAAYLAAFARAGGMQLVTLDRAVLSLTHEAL